VLEEDSVDRLWLVVRSLKTPNGKQVSEFEQFKYIIR
jgi:hypothetical protein